MPSLLSLPSSHVNNGPVGRVERWGYAMARICDATFGRPVSLAASRPGNPRESSLPLRDHVRGTSTQSAHRCTGPSGRVAVGPLQGALQSQSPLRITRHPCWPSVADLRPGFSTGFGRTWRQSPQSCPGSRRSSMTRDAGVTTSTPASASTRKYPTRTLSTPVDRTWSAADVGAIAGRIAQKQAWGFAVARGHEKKMPGCHQ